MSKEQQMIQASAELARIRQFSDSLLLDFQAALMRYDWAAAEVARVNYMAAIEALLDQFATLYRILEKA